MTEEKDILQEAADFINERIKQEWEAQGHRMSGAWEESIATSFEQDNHIIGVAKSYGVIVNYGVTPSRIPYGDSPTGAKSSKYIQGLFDYFKAKGYSDSKALSYAFATAKKQKKEGMSTIGSQRYSSTGMRQNFITEAEQDISGDLDNLIYDGLETVISDKVNIIQTETI